MQGPRATETARRAPHSTPGFQTPETLPRVPASLVIQTSFLGDVVLTTPLLRELARRGPVTVVVTPAAAPLLRGNPDIARLVTYDKRGADRGIFGFVRLARSVATRDPADTAYLAQGSHRSGALARVAGYARRVGFAASTGRRWYTAGVSVPDGLHHCERLWRLAGADRSPTPADLRPRLYPSADDEELVDDLLARNDTAGSPLLALAPGSVWGTKRWPGYADLARLLMPHGRPVIVGGAGDRELAAGICAAVPSAIDATGHLPLLASAAMIRRARVLVSNDSLPLHLATAMDTPTVAVFGPTVPAFGFGPLASRRAVAERHDLPCRPCHAHGPARCPLGHHRCMRELSAHEVLECVHAVLS